MDMVAMGFAYGSTHPTLATALAECAGCWISSCASVLTSVSGLA